MTNLDDALNLAIEYHQAGQLIPAEQLYLKVLESDPNQAEALHLLGVLASQQGRHESAVENIQRALAVTPNIALYHNNLAYALQALGRLNEAAKHFRKAIGLQPTFATAQNDLANVLFRQGFVEEALIHYYAALRLDPGGADARCNLGVALASQGKFTEARAHFEQAIRGKPDHAEAHYNLGVLAASEDKHTEAKPHLEQTLRLNPVHVDAHIQLAFQHANVGEMQKAESHLTSALRFRPADRTRVLLATLLPPIYQSTSEISAWRQRLIEQVRALREKHVVVDLTERPASTMFYLAYQGLNDRDLQRDIASLYSAPSVDVSRRVAGSKIRIAFVSRFFHLHTIGHLMRGLIAHLSRQSFEVTAVAVGNIRDHQANWIREHADHCVDLPQNLPSARRTLADRRFDVLFYTDIGMEPLTYALAMTRLAPVQCATWGHPVTTGIETVDYFISSKSLDLEDAQKCYTETLVRLENSPIYYYRPTPASPLPDRNQFGFTNSDHVYACPQALFKFHPDFDEILGGVLRGDPHGTLVLLEGKHPEWTGLLRQRFAKTLADVKDRIRFLPRLGREDFLGLSGAADVLLDPVHFGGGNTSYEALSLGVPIVTMPSHLLRGRITAALYKQMEVLDCIAASPDEYIKLAVRLGTDRDYREIITSKINTANQVLFENSAGLRELEHFLEGAVEQASHQF